MKDNHSSKTAYGVARLRAAHQIYDLPKVFDDPIAVRIVGEEALSSFQPVPRDPAKRRYARALRAAIVVRSRYAEDELGREVANGVRQYVILGAGLDTFAYRQSSPGLRIFEVDHPATQEWKQQRLRLGGINRPGNLTYAPIDFERESLDAVLARAGLDFAAPVFFSWLGVTPYLTRAAIFSTLEFIASSMPAMSAVVFDYLTPVLHLNARRNAEFALMAGRVAELGEPWRTYLDSIELVSELRRIGFEAVEELGADQLNARYFQDREDGLKLAGGSRLVRATV